MPESPTPLDVGEREEVKRLAQECITHWAAYIADPGPQNAARLEYLAARGSFRAFVTPDRIARLVAQVERMAEDAALLDAIERGEVEIECMGTTHKYQWVHGPGGMVCANASEEHPKSLRDAIRAARVVPTTAPLCTGCGIYIGRGPVVTPSTRVPGLCVECAARSASSVQGAATSDG